MVRILTNLAKVKHTKSYKQIENIILNISFDRKIIGFQALFRDYVKESIDLKKHMQKYT